MDNRLADITNKMDRLIELLETMTSNETKLIKKELSELHDWKTSSEAMKKSKSTFLEMLRWFGPWIIAFLYILFEHKLR